MSGFTNLLSLLNEMQESYQEKKGVIIPLKLVLVLYLGLQNLASNWIQIFKYFKVLFTTELQRKRKSKKNQSRLITYTSSGEMDDLWGYMH